MKKKLFRHGGSKSVDLPASFVHQLPTDYVRIQQRKDGSLVIYPVEELTAMESSPFFARFIDSLLLDAMTHPEKLKDAKEVWDEEWDSLLEGVDSGEE